MNLPKNTHTQQIRQVRFSSKLWNWMGVSISHSQFSRQARSPSPSSLAPRRVRDILKTWDSTDHHTVVVFLKILSSHTQRAHSVGQEISPSFSNSHYYWSRQLFVSAAKVSSAWPPSSVLLFFIQLTTSYILGRNSSSQIQGSKSFIRLHQFSFQPQKSHGMSYFFLWWKRSSIHICMILA